MPAMPKPKVVPPEAATLKPTAGKPSISRLLIEAMVVAIVTAVVSVLLDRWIVHDITAAVMGGVAGGAIAAYVARRTQKKKAPTPETESTRTSAAAGQERP